jgi:hypothetical protein
MAASLGCISNKTKPRFNIQICGVCYPLAGFFFFFFFFFADFEEPFLVGEAPAVAPVAFRLFGHPAVIFDRFRVLGGNPWSCLRRHPAWSFWKRMEWLHEPANLCLQMFVIFLVSDATASLKAASSVAVSSRSIAAVSVAPSLRAASALVYGRRQPGQSCPKDTQ